MPSSTWNHVLFSLAGGWEELSADPREVGGPAWRRWAVEGLPDDGKPGDFGWMAGLVSPEVQQLSNAYREKVRAEAAEAKAEAEAEAEADGEEDLAFPLAEVHAYLRAARRLPVETRVFGSTTPAALAFLCCARTPLTQVETDRLYERLQRWSGLRVSGGGDAGPGFDEAVGDSYGTMDWGLHDAVTRGYHAQPLFVFAAARSFDALEAGLAGLVVRSSPDHPVRPPAGTGSLAAPDDPPGPAFAALVEAWSAVTEPAFVSHLAIRFGPVQVFLTRSSGHWEHRRRGGEATDGAEALPAAVRDYRMLTVEHGAPDLASVELSTGNFDRPDELRLFGAAVRAVAESCGVELAPPAGQVLCPSPWASAVHPETLVMTKVAPFAPAGGLLLDKHKRDLKVVTTYYRVGPAGLEPLRSKREATSLLAEWVVAHAKRTRALPVHTTVADGKVTYAPNRYDTFTFPLSKKLLGSDPKAWVKGLGTTRAEQPPIDEDRAPWKAELAKSGRSTCKACGAPIEADSVRVGSPSDYEGRATWRWHHLACAAPRLRTPEKLVGFADLPPKAAQTVRDALRRD